MSVWREMSISRAFRYISFKVFSKVFPPPGIPHTAHIDRDIPFLEPSFICVSETPVNEPSNRFPSGVPMERGAHYRNLLLMSPGIPNKQSLLLQQNLTFLSDSLVKWSPIHGPLWRVMLLFQSQWFIHSFGCVSQSPSLRSSPMKQGKNIRSTYTELHADRRIAYDEVWPGSTKGLFMTLLLLPHFHAAFSIIPSTFAWIDQSPISQHVPQ